LNLNIEQDKPTTRIRLNKPYKIIAAKEKLYDGHYHIPAATCLIIPQKRLDEDFSCYVYWQDHDGRHTLYNLMFTSENLEALDVNRDEQILELWKSLNR